LSRLVYPGIKSSGYPLERVCAKSCYFARVPTDRVGLFELEERREAYRISGSGSG